MRSRLFPAIIFAMCSAPLAFGSLWEDPQWALLGTLSGTTGYDSNLTLLHDGPGSFFVAANPYLTLSRQNSDSLIDITVGVTETDFTDGAEPRETDLNAGFTILYPNVFNVPPVYDIRGSWKHSSEPDQFLGQRVAYNQFNLSGEGNLRLSGKLGLRGLAAFDAEDYDSSTLNDSVRGSLLAGLTYSSDPQTQFSINVSDAEAHSTPNDTTRAYADVYSNEYNIFARVSGQITDKVSGVIYGGFGDINYTGGYQNSSAIPVAGANLTWGLDPRRTIVLAAFSGATNAPDGTAVDTTNAFISFTDVVVSGWQVTVRTGPTRSVFSQKVAFRHDTSWAFGGEVAYNPSLRFKVALDASYERRTSDFIIYAYNHELVSLNASYTF